MPEAPPRAGSSPHTRGARIAGLPGWCQRRIIPAYAGSTVADFQIFATNWDHPRIRGEHYRRCRRRRRVHGSSPHTRGAQGRRVRRARCTRIIPAYAGSTLSSVVASSSPADHPRIRGEHICARQRTLRNLRIIPAYAGSTMCHSLQSRTRRDHPRIRGEHISCSRFVPAIMGSSPHTRGAPCRVVFKAARQRIIPAYAGSTERTTDTLSRSSDHPRIRGEHKSASMLERRPPGSSPHTRGAPPAGPRRNSGSRIIPAYAGSTPANVR